MTEYNAIWKSNSTADAVADFDDLDDVIDVVDDDGAEEELEIRFSVTEDRLRGMKAGIWRRAEQSATAQFELVAQFMVDENGVYLSQDDAYAILDDLTLDDLGEVFQALYKAMTDAVVPKKAGRQSIARRTSTTR